MFELRFRELAVSEIQGFIRSYEEGFFALYRDSGVWAEDLIIENYRQAALRLSRRIFESIRLHLDGGDGKMGAGDKILARWCIMLA